MIIQYRPSWDYQIQDYDTQDVYAMKNLLSSVWNSIPKPSPVSVTSIDAYIKDVESFKVVAALHEAMSLAHRNLYKSKDQLRAATTLGLDTQPYEMAVAEADEEFLLAADDLAQGVLSSGLVMFKGVSQKA